MTIAFILAVPNKGRLKEPTLSLLSKIGFKVPKEETRKLYYNDNHGVEIIFLRAFDIPKIVERGGADVGITGYDLVKERDAQVSIPIRDLGFGHSNLVIAGPKNSEFKSIYDIKPIHTIATSYPTIITTFVHKKNIFPSIININGALEIMPRIGISHFIADIISTGETLRKNDMKILEDGEVMRSSACLIANTQSVSKKEEHINDMINKLLKVIK